MTGIQCKCGRFLGHAYAVSAAEGEGYSWHEFVADVRGSCRRCGADVAAARGWWFSWDAWTWRTS